MQSFNYFERYHLNDVFPKHGISQIVLTYYSVATILHKVTYLKKNEESSYRWTEEKEKYKNIPLSIHYLKMDTVLPATGKMRVV